MVVQTVLANSGLGKEMVVQTAVANSGLGKEMVVQIVVVCVQMVWANIFQAPVKWS